MKSDRKYFRKYQDLYDLQKQTEQTFIPGISPVPYAGRVYDEKEMISSR